MGYAAHAEYMPGGKWGVRIKLVCRALQAILGATIFGVYTNDLIKGVKAGAGADPAWTFASFVGGLSMVVALVYLLPFIKAFALFWLDLLIFIFHSALIGVFGKAYINPKVPVGDSKQVNVIGPDATRMKHLAHIDIVSGILWFCTGLFGLFVILRVRHMKKHEDKKAWFEKSLGNRMSSILAPV